MHDGLSSSVYVLLPILAQHLSLGFSQIGLIRAVYTGAMWIIEIPAGILSERLGESRLLVLGIIGSGIGFFAVSFTEGYYGVLLALFMSNGGGAWDNAKKHVEAGNLGGKGSDAHHATVVGDTVGDPLKDTSGPAMNILIKLMSIVSLVMAPFFL